MGDHAFARTSYIFENDFDAEVIALLTVVEHRYRPSELSTLWIVARVIVTAVVDRLLHAGSPAVLTRREQWLHTNCRTPTRSAAMGAQMRRVVALLPR